MNQPQVVGLGIIIILLGMIIIFSSIFLANKGASKTESKFAVFGLIGPVPFGFANDKKMLFASIAIAILFAAIFLFAFLRK